MNTSAEFGCYGPRELPRQRLILPVAHELLRSGLQVHHLFCGQPVFVSLCGSGDIPSRTIRSTQLPLGPVLGVRPLTSSRDGSVSRHYLRPSYQSSVPLRVLVTNAEERTDQLFSSGRVGETQPAGTSLLPVIELGNSTSSGSCDDGTAVLTVVASSEV